MLSSRRVANIYAKNLDRKEQLQCQIAREVPEASLSLISSSFSLALSPHSPQSPQLKAKCTSWPVLAPKVASLWSEKDIPVYRKMVEIIDRLAD